MNKKVPIDHLKHILNRRETLLKERKRLLVEIAFYKPRLELWKSNVRDATAEINEIEKIMKEFDL